MDKEQPEPSAGSQPTFEEALGQLQAIVQELEEGEIGLDEALAQYEQGVKLLRHCHELLKRAERRIELLTGVDADSNPITTALDDTFTSLDEKARERSRRRSALPTQGSPGRENTVLEGGDAGDPD